MSRSADREVTMRLLAMLALAAVLVGCGRSSETAAELPPPISGTIVGGTCTGSLAEYCRQAGGPCPRLEAAIARRRNLCSQPGSWTVVERQCAHQFRSVRWREAVLGGGEEFFADDGGLAAASLTTDYPAYCGGQSFTQVFGPIPTCEGEVVTTSLCGS
jgi:hypothetical protein